MQLKRFQIKNYRSIIKTPVISVGRNLTIIGPNNEGKSNLVRALVTSLQILEDHSRGLSALSRIRRRGPYDWPLDCPIQLQSDPTTKTVFTLNFHLNDDDREDFRHSIGSVVNDNLPIEITIGSDHKANFNVNKQGPAKAALSSKSRQVASYIGTRLSINHIAAVRTANEAVDAMEGIIASSLRQVEKSQEYRDAVATVEKLQKPILEGLEHQLSETLKQFLPSIKKVSLEAPESRLRALRSTQVSIDDGQSTPLSHKGDGVISLVGMALLAQLTSESGSDLNTILAIEEPESHLHPRAIHNIRSILDNISKDYQVIVTTHSPALVNRLDLSANVLVQDNKASVVSDISTIRDALGVRVSDNMTNSRIAVVCEGTDDGSSLKRMMCDLEPKLIGHLKTSDVSFVPLNGSGNLSYIATNLQNSICEPVCFLDADEAGKNAAEAAKRDNVISDDDIVYAILLGKQETELEDLVDPTITGQMIKEKYKADLNAIPPGFKKKKFSVRLKAAMEMAGRPFDEKIKAQAKAIIAQRISQDGISIIPEENRGPIRSLAELVLERLEKNKQ